MLEITTLTITSKTLDKKETRLGWKEYFINVEQLNYHLYPLIIENSTSNKTETIYFVRTFCNDLPYIHLILKI